MKRVVAPSGAKPRLCILNGTALVYTLSSAFVVVNIEDDRIIAKVFHGHLVQYGFIFEQC